MNSLFLLHLASYIMLVIAIILTYVLRKYPLINMAPSILCIIIIVLNIGAAWTSLVSALMVWGALGVGVILFVSGFCISLSILWKKFQKIRGANK